MAQTARRHSGSGQIWMQIWVQEVVRKRKTFHGCSLDHTRTLATSSYYHTVLSRSVVRLLSVLRQLAVLILYIHFRFQNTCVPSGITWLSTSSASVINQSVQVFESHQVLRGLHTPPQRPQRQCRNAAAAAVEDRTEPSCGESDTRLPGRMSDKVVASPWLTPRLMLRLHTTLCT